MKWKKELEGLVEANKAFVKRVKGETSAIPSAPVALPPDEAAEPLFDPPVIPAPEMPEEPPATQQWQPSLADDPPLPPPPLTGSEREDIEQHVEHYRANQRNRLQQNDTFYERQMDRIRAIMNPPPKSR